MEVVQLRLSYSTILITRREREVGQCMQLREKWKEAITEASAEGHEAIL